MNKNNMENTFLRLSYALREYKDYHNTTIILGAGCSLGATDRDISTIGIMKQCLTEHGLDNCDDLTWDKLYSMFVNVVWQGKAQKERELLLKKKLDNIEPSEGHNLLRTLVKAGYIHNVITTNFDMLLEKTFCGLSYNKRVGENTYKHIGDNPSFNLLKVHGDLEEGEFRFSPDELMALPKKLQKDITKKTAGLLIFVGYRGQDIGLMNCISQQNTFSVYWIDINEPDLGDSYNTRHIFEFMNARNSTNNFLCGKEYGDFCAIMTKLNAIILCPSHTDILKSKEHNLLPDWKNTSVIEALSIYVRLYEIFLDLLDISKKIQQENVDDVNEAESLYIEYLHSYLYYFNSKRSLNSLLHISNNEIDALILGTALEVTLRTLCNHIDPKEFIHDLQIRFRRIYQIDNIIDDSFWLAVEKVVCSTDDIDNTVKVYMNDKLLLQSYDVPLEELRELLTSVKFLSLLVPNLLVDDEWTFLNGRYENIVFENGKMCVNLGVISASNFNKLYNTYLINMPNLKKISEKRTSSKKYLSFISKWCDIEIGVK